MWGCRMSGIVAGMLACFVAPCVTAAASSAVPAADDGTGFPPSTRSSLDYGGWKPIGSSVPPVTSGRAARNLRNTSAATQETRRSYLLVYPPKSKEQIFPSSGAVAAPPAVGAAAVERKQRQPGFRPVQKNGRQSPPLRAYPTQVNYHRWRNVGTLPQQTLLKSATTEHPKTSDYRPPAVVYQRSPVSSKPKRRPGDAQLRLPSSPQASHHQIQIQLLDGFIVPPAQGIQHYDRPGEQAAGGRSNHVRAVPITLNDVPEIKLLLPGDVHEQLTKLQHSSIREILTGEQREKTHGQKQQRPGHPAESAHQNPVPHQAVKTTHQAPTRGIPRQNVPKENYPNANHPGQDLSNVHQNIHFPSQEVIHRPQQFHYGHGNAQPQVTNDHRNFYATDVQGQRNEPKIQPVNHNRPSYPNNVDHRNKDTNPFRPIQSHSANNHRRPEGVYSQPDPREYPQKPLNAVSFPVANHQSTGNVPQNVGSYGSAEGTQQQKTDFFVPERHQQQPNQEHFTTDSQPVPEQGEKTQQNFQSYENSGHFNNQAQFHSQTFNGQTSSHHTSSHSASSFQQQEQNGQSENFHKETHNGQAHVEQANVSFNEQQQQVTEFFPEPQQQQVTEFFPEPQQQQQQATPEPGSNTVDYTTSIDNQRQTDQKQIQFPPSVQSQIPEDFVQQKVEQGEDFDVQLDARRLTSSSDSDHSASDGGYSGDQNYPTQEKVVGPESGHQVANGEGGTCQCHQNCAPVYHPTTNYAGGTLREIASQVNAGALFEFISVPDDEIEALLASTGPYTLFLPSNEAISRIPQNLMDQWRQNDQDFSLALLNHVVTGRVTLDDLKLGGRMESRVPGSTLFINNYNNEAVTVNGHRIVRGDISGPRDGTVHVVDGMLCPVGDQDIIDTLRSCNKYDGFLTLADVTKLMETLQGEGPFTVFLPSNEALTKIPTDELGVLKENVTALRSFLEYHIIQGAYFSGDLKDGQYLTTLFERKPLRVGVRVDGCHRRLMEANNSPLCKADIPARNGVIHVVDWTLRPTDLEWCDGVIFP